MRKEFEKWETGVWSLGYFRPRNIGKNYCTLNWCDLHTKFQKWMKQSTASDLYEPDPGIRFVDAFGSASWLAEHLNDKANTWHQDSWGSDMIMVLWSTHSPTEIRELETGNVYIPDPYEVVMFNNIRFEHRCPKMSKHDSDNRIFIRDTIH